MFLVLLPNRRPVVLVPALVAVAGFVVLAMQGGPEVSDAERVWISEWARGAEAVFRRAVRTPWGLYQAGWDALGPGLALTVTIGTVTSLLQPRFRRLGLFALSGAFAFLVAEAVGPHIPALAPLAYAARLIPVLAIGLAIP